MKTPQTSHPELAAALNVPELWLKREDQHHFGSHKGRSIPLMIDHYWHQDGLTAFTISSSGNAALAAAMAVSHHNNNHPTNPISLHIFVGQKIPTQKIARLQALTDAHITLEQVANPKQAAFQLDASGGAKNLRQSTDDLALQGYHELAEELLHIPNLQAVFIPTSSGTCAQAVAEYFVAHANPIPQVHVVQTDVCHPIAAAFQNPLCPTHARTPEVPKQSLASAIVDSVAHRKFPVIEAVLKTKGSGWIVNDTEIQHTINLTAEKTKLTISPNSALSVAGLAQATAYGQAFTGPAACIITGI